MNLHTLKPSKGSRSPRKRIGRGQGSGTGKTAGRGMNGQKSRSGAKISPGFEGGQMPLARRLPKVGFTNIFRVEYEIVNLARLEKLGVEGEIDAALLIDRGVVRKNRPIKILGVGDITRALTIKADRFSKSAKDKIEKAGGKAVEV